MNINKLLYDPEDFRITKYEWRADGKLDVFQNVNLSNKDLYALPFSFGKIEGIFEAVNNNLDESSIPDLPEKSSYLILSRNKFKNLNNFNTKTDCLSFINNPLELIEGIKNFKFKTLDLRRCNKIKDWDYLPFVEENLILNESSIEFLDCLKNKNLQSLEINNTKINSIVGIEVNMTLSIDNNKISKLTGITKCPMYLYCDDDKKDQFINELKEMFPTSFNLKQVNWKNI